VKTQLAPGFLVASPKLEDPNFARSLVLMAEHGKDGAVGFIVNRPTQMPLAVLLRGVDRELAEVVAEGDFGEMKVLIGGPVQRHIAWVLYHRRPGEELLEGTIAVGERLVLGASMDVLRQLVRGERSGPFHVLLGYSGWGTFQLEGEIAHGSWLPLELEDDLTFGVPAIRRWEVAVERLGLTPGGFMMGGPGAMA